MGLKSALPQHLPGVFPGDRQVPKKEINSYKKVNQVIHSLRFNMPLSTKEEVKLLIHPHHYKQYGIFFFQNRMCIYVLPESRLESTIPRERVLGTLSSYWFPSLREKTPV